MLVVIFSVVVAAVMFSFNVSARYVVDVADVVVVIVTSTAVVPFLVVAIITVDAIVMNRKHVGC